jgi:hypothetical protein
MKTTVDKGMTLSLTAKKADVFKLGLKIEYLKI